MPYEIIEDGDEFCVHKEGGERIACHDTRDGAEAQIAALYASESKQLARPTQTEAAYVPLSATEGQACANCRWFNSDVSMCHIVENYPADVLVTGWCNRWEATPDAEMGEVEAEAETETEATEALEYMPGMDMEMDAEERAHEGHDDAPAAVVYAQPKPEGALEGIFKRLRHELRPGASVIKGADGKRYMLIVTSNSYVDRERETITTDALKSDVDRRWVGEDDAFVSDNPLLFWHDDRLVMGDIVWGDVRGPFYVEMAKENDAPLSALFFDHVEEHPEEKWGASHRFAYYTAHRSDGGDYARIFKQETSVLPRAVAANPLTYSGVLPMASKRDEYLNTMLGLENASDLLDKGIGALVEALQAQGIEHKAADDADAMVEKSAAQFGTLMLQLIEAQAAIAEKQDALAVAVDAKEKALDNSRAALDAELKAVRELADELKAQLDARPRAASKAPETELDPEKLPDAAKEALVRKDPFWGMTVKR